MTLVPSVTLAVFDEKPTVFSKKPRMFWKKPLASGASGVSGANTLRRV